MNMMESVLTTVFINSLLFPLLLLPLASTQTTYYVRPTSEESSCHHEDCLTLSEYASKTSRYFNSDNLTLVFLPGEHALNTAIDFQLFESLTLLGDLSSLPNITSMIVCNETTALTLKDISKVEIKALAFVYCGIQGKFEFNTSYGIPEIDEVIKSSNVFPTISALLIPNFHLVSCHMEHDQLPLLLNNSRAHLGENTFEDNSGGLGGAVAAYNSTVVFLGQNLFLGNYAGFGGGVFANRSELVFREMTAFINNTAEYGGGIGVWGSIITYENTSNTSMNPTGFNISCNRTHESTKIVQNLAASAGGGMCLVNSTLRQYGGTLNFTGNQAGFGGSGGGGVVAFNSSLITSYAIFERNLATGRLGVGGAVALQFSTWWFTVTTFVGNSAAWRGGAVYSLDSQLKFGTCVPTGVPIIASQQKSLFCPPDIQSHFRNNSARTGGGGAIAANSSTIEFSGNSNFEQNSVGQWGGGAIAANSSTIEFSGNSKIVQNLAASAGGGMCLVNSTLRQYGGTLNFTGNQAGFGGSGGGVVAFNSSLITSYAIFERNLATGRLGVGGAVALQFSTWWFTVTTFVGNSAACRGGAVHSLDSQLKFGTRVPTGVPIIASQQKSLFCPPDIQSHFRNNSARTGGGGAIAANSSTIEFSGSSKFEQNSVGGWGGGIDAIESTFMFTGYTTFKNNSGSLGGGIYARSSQLHFKEHTKFTDNYAKRGGGIDASKSILVFSEEIELFSNEAQSNGGGIAMRSRSTLNISGNGTCINNTAGGSGGVVSATNNSVVVLDGVNTIATNSAGISGGAVSVENSTLKIIGKCDFIGNWAHYSGGALNATRSDLFLSGVNSFISNVVKTDGYGGGIHAMMTLLTLNGLHTFTNNSARRGGGLAVKEQSMLRINGNANFRGNYASYGGAIFADEGSDLEFRGVVTFDNNVAKTVQIAFPEGYGGGIHLDNCRTTFSGLSNFTNNSARYGGAMSVRMKSTLTTNGNTNFRENCASYGGAIHVYGDSDLLLSGVVTFVNNIAKSVQIGYGGGIFAEESRIAFSGLSNFINNTAKRGGALAITSYGWKYFLYLTPNASVAFLDNHAQEYGGAIYAEDILDPWANCRRDFDVIRRTCFIAFDAFVSIDNHQLLVKLPEQFYETYQYMYKCIGHIVSEGNFAEEGGNTIYGGALHNCRVELGPENLCKQSGCSNKTCYMPGIEAIAALTRTSVDHLTTESHNVMSDTFKVCICAADSRKPNCKKRPVSYTAYPGETVFIPIAAVGKHDEVLSEAAIIQADIRESEGAWLGPLQNTQPANLCTFLGYTLFSNSTRPAKLTLSTEGPCGEPGIPLYVNVNFLPCPPGFALSQFWSCECEIRLQKYTNNCDINNRAFTHNGGFWVGFDHHSHDLVLHPHCPFDYCTSETVSFTFNSTDLQCAHSRSGTLCGACKSGLSLNLGSSQCSPCSNVFLLLFLPFAIAGFLLVIFLFTCKVTVAAGTTSGLIFYANVVAVNRSVFFPSGETNILTVFIAWLNLDLGIEMCFFDGMDVYTRTWLQFVFPFYIWLLVGIITLVSYYSMSVARIIGRTNPVSVLATLFLLSYTKLIRTIIATFSFTTLDYPNDRSVTVWAYDGNIGYFEGKHIPFFLAGLLAFLLLFLPYTLLLLFGQCIEAGSNHKLLSWANSLKVRSFLDAYHAPYKNRHRYWTGLLLVLRFALFTVSAVIDINSPRDPSINFLVLGITCLGLAVWAWNIGNMYKKWCNNVLESSFILNLGVLALASYQVKVEGGNQAAVAYTSVSISFVTFLGIIVYHLAERVKDSRMWRNSIGPKLQHLKESLINREQLQDPIEMAVPPTASPPPVTTTFVDLREPLLESLH